MLGTLCQSIAIMGQRLGEAELARADVVIRPQVLDIGPPISPNAPAPFSKVKKPPWPPCTRSANASPRFRPSARAAQMAQQKMREAEYKACLEKRSSLQKLAGTAGMGRGAWG